MLENEDLDAVVARTVDYQTRLGISGRSSSLFVNGVPVARDESWLQDLSMQINKDLRFAQQSIVEGQVEEDTWLPEIFLAQAFERRNPLVIPEDPKNVRIVDIAKDSSRGLKS